jgi:hypothetical protein
LNLTAQIALEGFPHWLLLVDLARHAEIATYIRSNAWRRFVWLAWDVLAG